MRSVRVNYQLASAPESFHEVILLVKWKTIHDMVETGTYQIFSPKELIRRIAAKFVRSIFNAGPASRMTGDADGGSWVYGYDRLPYLYNQRKSLRFDAV